MMEKKTSWEIGDPAHAYTLPARFFYDPDVYRLERDAIFYKAWHVVAHQTMSASIVATGYWASGAAGCPACCAAAIIRGATATMARCAARRAAKNWRISIRGNSP